MSQPLQYSGFKWKARNKEGKLDRRQKGKGWILEVNLEYPKELHKYHNDYPLAPGKIVVKKRMALRRKLFENNSMINIQKLVSNLMDKNKYVVHYRNLQLYLSLCMKRK